MKVVILSGTPAEIEQIISKLDAPDGGVMIPKTKRPYNHSGVRRKTMSAAGRRHISEALKRSYAVKKGLPVAPVTRRKRLSAASRRHIAEGVKKSWKRRKIKLAAAALEKVRQTRAFTEAQG